MGSSLPSGASTYLSAYFHVSNQQQLVLPNSTYLIGYIFGPPLFSPLSETYGRKIVMLCTFAGFTIFTMACALAPNWPVLLIFRFVVGAFASAPISVVGGMYADIYEDPVYRGRAVAVLIGVRLHSQDSDSLAEPMTVHNPWTCTWTGYLRFRIASIMEVDFLDCSHHCRGIMAASFVPSR